MLTFVDSAKKLLCQLSQEKLLFSLLLVILAALLTRPVLIVKDGIPRGTIWLWPWSSIRISFTNSVTERPVEITCTPIWYFSNFSARTDPETEAYYTAGSYNWQDALAKEHPSSLSFCSVKGITVCTQTKCFSTDEGCLEMKLLWPSFR